MSWIHIVGWALAAAWLYALVTLRRCNRQIAELERQRGELEKLVHLAKLERWVAFEDAEPDAESEPGRSVALWGPDVPYICLVKAHVTEHLNRDRQAVGLSPFTHWRFLFPPEVAGGD